MSHKINESENQNVRQEHYSKCNFIFFHDIPENVDEGTNRCVVKTEIEGMKVEISRNDIDRSHRLDKLRKNKEKPGLIIVGLALYNVQLRVFVDKEVLKGLDISVTENLE